MANAPSSKAAEERSVKPPEELGDAELLERCKSGDERAWATLVRRFERLVYSIPYRYGLDAEAAEDVFQQVFTALVRQLPNIRRRTALAKWFITTTGRICGRWIEQNRRLSAAPADIEAPAVPTPEVVARWESQHLLRRALGRLGGRCRELIEGMYSSTGPVSYEELARKLGIPVGSIGPTRARCLEKLLEQMEELEQTEE
jgi:RNA polymerase sigma factor (sigma-70 family)